MTDKQSADKRLKRLLAIHKQLRQGACSGDKLADSCRALDEAVSLRTIRSDIYFMRRMLNAPVESSRYYGYRYARAYSLLEGLEDEPLGTLNEVLALVRQLAETNSRALAGLEEALLSLEQQVSVIRAEPNPRIEFENPDLKGRLYLIPLHRFLHRGVFVRICYQPYAATEPAWRTVWPLMLKEFNNRWYLIAWDKLSDDTRRIWPFALDRITQPPVETATLDVFPLPKPVDLTGYFQHVIGVTKTGSDPQWVVLRFSPQRALYVITKKIHPTQTEKRLPDGSYRVQLLVELNKELEAKILEFGPDVTVLEPEALRDTIVGYLQAALNTYTL
ncbi:WYL domain-containing transcriptional regulator [Nibrella viscosa]|uniref:WYL domain-containing transcriptional regulator n=1 Tax=Nibrella viscosa TaxID=1084524 RepID=A0ABP8JYU4_9BACT